MYVLHFSRRRHCHRKSPFPSQQNTTIVTPAISDSRRPTQLPKGQGRSIEATHADCAEANCK